MSRSFPYIQRRGFTLNFRIAVPSELQAVVGLSEITKALKTGDKHIAAPLALLYAARVKSVYTHIRIAVTDMDMDEQKLTALMALTKQRLQLEERHAQEQAEDRVALARLKSSHREELTRVQLETENRTLRGVMAAPTTIPVGSPTTSLPAAPGAPLAPSAHAPRSTTTPKLGVVVKGFLSRFPKLKSAPMFKKHSAVLPLMLDVIGDKPVDELRQSDLNKFFDLIQRLPPRWSDRCRQRRISVVALADEDHELTMAPKTFEDTYKACVRAFLRDARIHWQDEGFPTTLTTDGIAYVGDREDGEHKQRAFRDDELHRLFRGPEMGTFAQTPGLKHQHWLPLLGLYTGARVNELCQLNPLTDLLQEPQTAIWYLKIDEESDGIDAPVEKSVKNKPSFRKVPIHSRLIAHGFLDYVSAQQKARSKLLFPAWKPTNGRASPMAEKWFRGLLKDLGLRDETSGARLVGMHAFRHTMMHKAFNATPQIDVTSITGHTSKEGPVVRGYQGELTLTNKRELLEAVPFGL